MADKAGPLSESADSELHLLIGRITSQLPRGILGAPRDTEGEGNQSSVSPGPLKSARPTAPPAWPYALSAPTVVTALWVLELQSSGTKCDPRKKCGSSPSDASVSRCCCLVLQEGHRSAPCNVGGRATRTQAWRSKALGFQLAAAFCSCNRSFQLLFLATLHLQKKHWMGRHPPKPRPKN